MERDEIARTDFPAGPDGYDRRAVDAHLTAVAAFVDALRARVDALGVEIDALRGSRTHVSEPTGDRTTEETTEETIAPEPPGVLVGDAADLDGPSADPVSARLVASKLHLDGVARDEIVERLSSDYRLDDPEGLVDEVIEGLA